MAKPPKGSAGKRSAGKGAAASGGGASLARMDDAQAVDAIMAAAREAPADHGLLSQLNRRFIRETYDALPAARKAGLSYEDFTARLWQLQQRGKIQMVRLDLVQALRRPDGRVDTDRIRRNEFTPYGDGGPQFHMIRLR